MKKMKRVHIPLVLFNEIEEYCKVNDINSVQEEIISILKKGFAIEKFGISPFSNNSVNTNYFPTNDDNSVQDNNVFNNIEQDINNEQIKINEKNKCNKKQKKGINIIKKN